MRRFLRAVAVLFVVLWAPLLPARGAEAEHEPDLSGPFVREGVPHPGSDQILWVPTFAQAEAVARETGRMILVMGSVSDWDGY